jgi:para-nitrobenzyl esterase
VTRSEPQILPDGEADEQPVVATESGAVGGTERLGVAAFKGIPYAAAPVGALRWRSPRPAEPWDGVRDATRFRPIAPQPVIEISGQQPPVMNEDCLTLNIYTPSLGSAGLPVMVWIHGGAYYVGSSADSMFDGSGLAVHGDVVVVTLNYRLGALGYLDFTGFDRPDARFESNLGQRDQQAALEWVQRNIARFGGDPDQVTVFGESAGGGAVTTLMATPAARGLFHGAIAESSPVGSVYSRERAHAFAERFIHLVGVAPREIARLRELSPRQLTDACDQLVRTNPRVNPGTIPVAPVVDGDLVPDYPLTAFREGRAIPVPLVIGTNRKEAQLFRLMRSPILPTTAASIDAMIANLHSPGAFGILTAYRGYPSRSAAVNVSTDAAFRMPTIWAAAAHSVHAPTWVYEFDYARPALKALGLGAMHGAELPYVWGNRPATPISSVPLGGAKAAAAVAHRVQERWLSFARTQDVNAAGVEPYWPTYDATKRSTLMIDKVDRVVDDPSSTQRIAWGDEVISFF